MCEDGKVIDLDTALIKRLRPLQVIPANHPAEIARQKAACKAIVDRYGYREDGGRGDPNGNPPPPFSVEELNAMTPNGDYCG